MASRGVRNNNPGNIERNSTKWQGMAEDQSSDIRFIVFKSPQYGIRAIAVTIMTYSTKYGLNTVAEIINRWAPPGENNTAAYIEAVSAGMGVKPDTVIDVDNAYVMLPLVKAIIKHENGSVPYSDAVLMEGIDLAGVHGVPTKPLTQQTSFVTKGVAAVLGTGAAAANAVDPIHSLADKLGPYSASPVIQRAVTVLLTGAAVLLAWSVIASMLKQRAGL